MPETPKFTENALVGVLKDHPHAFLVDLGYAIKPHATSVNLWSWSSALEENPSAHETPEVALDYAWRDAVRQSLDYHLMTGEDFDAMTFTEQKSSIIDAIS